MLSVSPIKASDRIPVPQKVLFAAGCSFDHLAAGLTIGGLWMPYFNIAFGISPLTLGIILMILRGWDAFADPIVGNISDNARTRWGRRRPFMIVGAILTAALYPLLWRPPMSLDENGKIVYIVLVGIVFFSSFTLWSMPYYGMQLELTPNYDERTRLMSWIALFGKLSGLVGGWVLAVSSSRWFADPLTGKSDLAHGLQTCSWFIAALLLCLGLLPPLFVKERISAEQLSRRNKEPLWTSIKESFFCKPLQQLIGISFLMVLGGVSQRSVAQYVNIYFVNHGNLANATIIDGWKSTVTLVIGIGTLPLWTWLSEKLDKKIVVAGLLGCAIFGHLLNIFCLRADMPYLQLVPAVFESGVISAIWLFIPSMKADVADFDELSTSRRREGSLNAFYSWAIKVSSTCALGLGGLLLSCSGFDSQLPTQPQHVLERMKMMFLFLPVLIWSFAFLFIWSYPLNRGRMTEIRSQLETRRGKL